MSKKQRENWSHLKTCDYCQEHKLPGCKHYRGGKTARKRAK